MQQFHTISHIYLTRVVETYMHISVWGYRKTNHGKYQSRCWRSQRVLSASANRLQLITHLSISIILPMVLSLIQYSFEIFGCITMYVFMYVHHRICLDFKYGARNRGSFVHSQSIQKENRRTFRTQIKCDVENLRRNPLGN